MNRGTIQLSFNFIVTIILAVTLLGLGILILRQLVGGAEDIKLELDQQTEQQLAALLEQGQQIAVPFSTQTINRGTSHLFGAGVLNSGGEGLFEVSVELAKGVRNDDTEMSPQQLAQLRQLAWLRYERNAFPLGHGERRSVPVLVSVPKNAPPGTYIFNVRVLSNGQPYDTVKKIYVVVP